MFRAAIKMHGGKQMRTERLVRISDANRQIEQLMEVPACINMAVTRLRLAGDTVQLGNQPIRDKAIRRHAICRLKALYRRGGVRSHPAVNIPRIELELVEKLLNVHQPLLPRAPRYENADRRCRGFRLSFRLDPGLREIALCLHDIKILWRRG